MIRIISIVLLTLVLALGFSTLGVAKKGGGNSNHSGSGGGHGNRHVISDDSGRHRSNGAHGRTFNDEGQHHHGEVEFRWHGVGEIEIHRSGGHD